VKETSIQKGSIQFMNINRRYAFVLVYKPMKVELNKPRLGQHY